jgi:filamentous hemagglutinin family protein
MKEITRLRPIVGAVVMALAAPAAMAAVTPPVANSVPGNFYANTTHVAATYSAGSNSAATITLSASVASSSAAVLQWGGSNGGLSAVTMATGASANPATNAGFDIGAGATLTIASTGTAPTAVLLNDITGNPSQVYGTVSASGVGPVYIANGNGIIVGSGGSVVAPAGLVLDGYTQDPGTFTSALGINIASGAVGTGDVTIAPGANLNAGASGFLLVAGNANVNIGSALVTAGSIAIAAGYAASATTGALQALTIGTASVLNSAATVNFNNVSGTIAPTSMGAAGNVNVLSGAYVTMPSAADAFIGGAFSNAGNATLAASTAIGGAFSNTGNVTLGPSATIGGNFTNTSNATLGASASIGGVFSNAANVTLTNNLTAGSIVNSGTLTGTGAATTALAATGTAGIINNGLINASGGPLALTATSGASAPITNNGVISNVTGGLTANASGLVSNNGTINFSTGSNSLGVTGANVNFYGVVNQGGTALSATNVLTGGVVLSASSTGILNLSNSLFASGASSVSGGAVRVLTGGLMDANGLTVYVGSGTIGSYGYNLSLFPGTTLVGSTVNVSGTSGSNINLDGVLGNVSTGTINITGGTINGSGGFSLASNGTLATTLAGNFNNPNGAAAAGHPGVFQYNYVPVNANGGTVTVELNPTNTLAASQLVNVMVTGNADLESNLTAPLTVGGATAVQSSYQNSHLVLQATGNLTVGSSATVYWPGLVYLGNINAGSPGSLSRLGTITLGHALNNALAANVTGSGGIFFMTSNPVGGLSSINTVLTNTNSWVNFPASTGFASAYAANNPSNKYFYDAVINSNTPGVISTLLLPAGDFQGR